jgi:hypothetical protein
MSAPNLFHRQIPEPAMSQTHAAVGSPDETFGLPGRYLDETFGLARLHSDNSQETDSPSP